MGEFVDRRSKSITRATVEKAYEKLKADGGQTIHGPKKLNVFGAPYIWALFSGLSLVEGKEVRGIDLWQQHTHGWNWQS